MYVTWNEAKEKYKGLWVVLKNPNYADEFHMELLGGEFVGTAKTQSEMFALVTEEDENKNPNDTYTGRHTEEDEAVGLLMSGF